MLNVEGLPSMESCTGLERLRIRASARWAEHGLESILLGNSCQEL